MERFADSLECPICRKPCKETDILQITEKNQSEDKKIVLTSLNLTMSTKLRALIKEIDTIHRQSPEEKMIVFSQWTSMLDICEVAMKDRGFSYGRLDGSLSQKDR
jgi:SNF2 family DNA or RNA helicase